MNAIGHREVWVIALVLAYSVIIWLWAWTVQHKHLIKTLWLLGLAYPLTFWWTALWWPGVSSFTDSNAPGNHWWTDAWVPLIGPIVGIHWWWLAIWLLQIVLTMIYTIRTLRFRKEEREALYDAEEDEEDDYEDYIHRERGRLRWWILMLASGVLIVGLISIDYQDSGTHLAAGTVVKRKLDEPKPDDCDTAADLVAALDCDIAADNSAQTKLLQANKQAASYGDLRDAASTTRRHVYSRRSQLLDGTHQDLVDGVPGVEPELDAKYKTCGSRTVSFWMGNTTNISTWSGDDGNYGLLVNDENGSTTDFVQSAGLTYTYGQYGTYKPTYVAVDKLGRVSAPVTVLDKNGNPTSIVLKACKKKR